MKWNAQIISHTHWDREWYLNSKYTNEWLIPFFDSLLAMFEKEEEYQFVLDGQMSMIDDYYEELEKHGRPVYVYRSKIAKYVQEGRLFVGPYYLQPDWQLLSEEALVRNLLIGTRKAEEYGKRMNVGWLLDNFGQISQTSQIHAEAEIEGLYAWRGVEMDPFNVRSEFMWESPDGTRLPSVYLLNSYRNVMRLAEHDDIMQKRIYDEVEKLKDFMTTKNILMMNGYDQEMVPDDIQPYIKSGELNSDKIEVVHSNPECYLHSVLAEKPELITLKGALYSGRFISVFPGVMSSRMYLKLQNDNSQKAIEKYAEPLTLINWLYGSDYDRLTLEKAWELLLKNHPHDSICGVSIDDVHSDMENRTRYFHFLINHLIRQSVQGLLNHIDTSELNEENYFVFNPCPYSRSEVVTINGENYFLNDIAPFGYTYVKKNEVIGEVKKEGLHLWNNKIDVTINENGSIDLYHKETNQRYKNLGMIEESGDAGDEYNYSYPDNDQYIHSKDVKACIRYLTISPEKAAVEVRFDLELPKSLTKDRKSRSSEKMKMPVRTVYTIEANSDVIKVTTDIKNTVRDHIVKVLFPTSINTTVSYAGSPFDVVERPIHINDYDEEMIPDNVRRVIIGAREAKPNTIFLGRELVDINDGCKGLAVLSKGIPEYTVYREKNTIAMTLFRAVGWVAKEINTRIGDAGPEILAPEAQCLRQMTFEYAVYPHKGNYDDGDVLRQADRFNGELMSFVTNNHKGVLPASMSFVEVSDEKNAVRVTAMKRSECGKGIILRMYNGTDRSAHAEIKTPFKIRDVKRVNLLEHEKQKLDLEENKIGVPIAPKKIETLLITVERDSIDINAQAHSDILNCEEPYDFSSYETMPLVTKEEIEEEEERAEGLKTGLDKPLYRRSALEAQLSVILSKNRYHEGKVYELGYLLNEARVSRRVYDYIKDIVDK